MQRASEMLRIGARLEVGVGVDALEWLPSRVEDVTADCRVVVGWPMDRDRRLAHLAPGDTVELLAAVGGDALYATTVRVVTAEAADVPLVTVDVTGPWRRTQRRRAVREKVAVRPRVARCLYGGGASRPLRLGVTNVSATGVQVRSQDELRRGDLLELAFDLDGEIEVQARVTRVQRLERVWAAGCEFEGISERMSDRIVQFIFAQQRAALRVQRGVR
jgi:c-di-GMP-binding flagellar brake protein YcgR